jgi:hypothetical protein
MAVLAAGAIAASAGKTDTLNAPAHTAAVVNQAAGKSAVPIAPAIDTFLMKNPAKSPDTETIGSRYIRIQLADSSKSAAAYAGEYNRLVSAVSGALDSGTRMNGAAFMDRLLDIEGSDLHMVVGAPSSGLLSEALRTGLFGDETAAILDLDVAGKLGIGMRPLFVPGQVLLRAENSYFETSSGSSGSMADIRSRYPVMDTAAGPERLLAMACCRQGMAYADRARARRMKEPGQAAGDFGLALDACRRAIALDTSYASAYCELGNVYIGMKQLQPAIDAYTQAIAHDSAYADAYYQRGNAHVRSHFFIWAAKDYGQAVRLFERAIRLDPQNAQALTLKRADAAARLDLSRKADSCTANDSPGLDSAIGRMNRLVQ